MATAVNSSVKCYAGVPLIPGGTEVLYLAQGAAEGALSGFLRRSFSQYYYVRENGNYIQVDCQIGDLEGCNYVSFANYSHGGKLYFGFITALDYVNDNCTGIVFEIDPFPTYLGDCREDVPFVIRNTPKFDSPALIAEDFDFRGRKFVYDVIGDIKLPLSKTMTIFTGGRLVNEEGAVIVDTDSLGATPLSLYGFETGILYKYNMPASNVKLITQAGGSILGVYAVDSGFDPATMPYAAIEGTLDFSPANHAKLWNGQYNKVVLSIAGKAKTYDLNKFFNRETVSFRIKRLVSPTPVIVVYPINYEGMYDCTAEALIVEYPMLATSIGAYYNASTAIENLKAMAIPASYGLMHSDSGIYTSGLIGGLMRIAGLSKPFYEERGSRTYIQNRRDLMSSPKLGFGESVVNIGSAVRGFLGSMTQGEINTSAGGLVLTEDNAIRIQLIHVKHDSEDIRALDRYFDFYGYAYNEFMEPNLDNDAYLQTGTSFLSGSEADIALNAAIARGIKIKKSF